MVKAFLSINEGSKPLGRLDLELYEKIVPKTVANFCYFLRQTQPGKGYRHSQFHRIIPGFMAQGGDFINSDGTGSTSIYNGGTEFADENFAHSHSKRGILSMANSGPNTNGCQFFITFRPTPHLDGKHVVFGHVNLESNNSSGRAVLQALENCPTASDDRPTQPMMIVDCGVIEDVKKHSSDIVEKESKSIVTTIIHDQNELVNVPETTNKGMGELEEGVVPKTKAEAMKLRMRKLKLKINQARELNKQEVVKEGERLGSTEGADKERKRRIIQAKKAAQAGWEARNAKALEVAKVHGVDGKHLVEQAERTLKSAFKKEEKAQANKFEMHDYYNPEGQHRNYERNLRSLPRAAGLTQEGISSEKMSETFNPILNVNTIHAAREREGARYLANEMKRRIEKQSKKKRERMEFEQADVSYINQRNKRFNQKISRNFDKHTAEIRQNLERGTAL